RPGRNADRGLECGIRRLFRRGRRHRPTRVCERRAARDALFASATRSGFRRRLRAVQAPTARPVTPPFQPSGSRTGRRCFGSRLLGYSAADLEQVAELQVDNALVFEGVNNTLKLLGDQYLARIHRLANRRFHIEEWDASIMRKLQPLESIYEKMSDQAATRRL